MDSKRTPPREPATTQPANGKLAARQKREAAALRANLRKRKDQAQARDKPKPVCAVFDAVRLPMTADDLIAWAMGEGLATSR